MKRRTVFLMIAGSACLLVAPWAIARACSCSWGFSEERYNIISSITQLDGRGDHVDAELARWGGKTKLTLWPEFSGDSVRLWLRVHFDDGPVRNVRIDAMVPGAEDTGDGYDSGDTGSPGGAR